MLGKLLEWQLRRILRRVAAKLRSDLTDELVLQGRPAPHQLLQRLPGRHVPDARAHDQPERVDGAQGSVHIRAGSRPGGRCRGGRCGRCSRRCRSGCLHCRRLRGCLLRYSGRQRRLLRVGDEVLARGAPVRLREGKLRGVREVQVLDGALARQRRCGLQRRLEHPLQDRARPELDEAHDALSADCLLHGLRPKHGRRELVGEELHHERPRQRRLVGGCLCPLLEHGGQHWGRCLCRRHLHVLLAQREGLSQEVRDVAMLQALVALHGARNEALQHPPEGDHSRAQLARVEGHIDALEGCGSLPLQLREGDVLRGGRVLLHRRLDGAARERDLVQDQAQSHERADMAGADVLTRLDIVVDNLEQLLLAVEELDRVDEVLGREFLAHARRVHRHHAEVARAVSVALNCPLHRDAAHETDVEKVLRAQDPRDAKHSGVLAQRVACEHAVLGDNFLLLEAEELGHLGEDQQGLRELGRIQQARLVVEGVALGVGADRREHRLVLAVGCSPRVVPIDLADPSPLCAPEVDNLFMRILVDDLQQAHAVLGHEVFLCTLPKLLSDVCRLSELAAHARELRALASEGQQRLALAHVRGALQADLPVLELPRLDLHDALAAAHADVPDLRDDVAAHGDLVDELRPVLRHCPGILLAQVLRQHAPGIGREPHAMHDGAVQCRKVGEGGVGVDGVPVAGAARVALHAQRRARDVWHLQHVVGRVKCAIGWELRGVAVQERQEGISRRTRLVADLADGYILTLATLRQRPVRIDVEGLFASAHVLRVDLHDDVARRKLTVQREELLGADDLGHVGITPDEAPAVRDLHVHRLLLHLLLGRDVRGDEEVSGHHHPRRSAVLHQAAHADTLAGWCGCHLDELEARGEGVLVALHVPHLQLLELVLEVQQGHPINGSDTAVSQDRCNQARPTRHDGEVHGQLRVLLGHEAREGQPHNEAEVHELRPRQLVHVPLR
mmetsp:Transcript_75175/g.168333  ORF Transcript_75175/g.168333 Transcript_75175/m.168333 type:complete len:961 (-) Transcript_75175:3749-6631(-)